jgi:uncharacterized protein (TIGR00661 family)
MRIVYSVHGYGRGHASRTLAVLPYLMARHQVLILAGGDAFATIGSEHPVVRIPTMAFAYSQGSKSRRRSNWQTFKHNLPAALDLLWHGPTFQLVRESITEFAPDVIISDAEAWSHHVGSMLGIPRISFDHIGIMAYCRPPLAGFDRITSWLDASLYRILIRRPDRVIVSSFYEAAPRNRRVRIVAALPRDAVRRMQPSTREHLLVYFNRGHEQLNDKVLAGLHDLKRPIHVYGTLRRGRAGLLEFLPPSHTPFLEDLASCCGVISTAGNQLVGEAMFLGKPVLVFPESCAEQRMNALAVERLGIGMRADFRDFSAQTITRSLDRRDEFTANIGRNVRDGLPEALAAINQALQELAPAAAPTRASASTGDAAGSTATGDQRDFPSSGQGSQTGDGGLTEVLGNA